MIKEKSFLKWAGNKYRVLPHISKALPSGDRLVEPFVGSGAVFLNFPYSRYLLAETNPDLINLFKTIKREGDRRVAVLKTKGSTGSVKISLLVSRRRDGQRLDENVRRGRIAFIQQR